MIPHPWVDELRVEQAVLLLERLAGSEQTAPADRCKATELVVAMRYLSHYEDHDWNHWRDVADKDMFRLLRAALLDAPEPEQPEEYQGFKWVQEDVEAEHARRCAILGPGDTFEPSGKVVEAADFPKHPPEGTEPAVYEAFKRAMLGQAVPAAWRTPAQLEADGCASWTECWLLGCLSNWD